MYRRLDVRAAFDTYVAADYVQHNPGLADGRDAARDALAVKFADPAFSIEVVRMLVDGDVCALHLRASRDGRAGGRRRRHLPRRRRPHRRALGRPPAVARHVRQRPPDVLRAMTILGTTLFSFTPDWRAGADTASLLQRVADAGCGPALEVIGHQAWRGFPHVVADDERAFRDAVDRLGLDAGRPRRLHRTCSAGPGAR